MFRGRVGAFCIGSGEVAFRTLEKNLFLSLVLVVFMVLYGLLEQSSTNSLVLRAERMSRDVPNPFLDTSSIYCVQMM